MAFNLMNDEMSFLKKYFDLFSKKFSDLPTKYNIILGQLLRISQQLKDNEQLKLSRTWVNLQDVVIWTLFIVALWTNLKTTWTFIKSLKKKKCAHVLCPEVSVSYSSKEFSVISETAACQLGSTNTTGALCWFRALLRFLWYKVQSVHNSILLYS